MEIKRRLTQRSARVKSVDLHPTEPWLLLSMHNGTMCIWDHATQTLLKSIEVTAAPVRSAKFIARKRWVVAGADDGRLRVYSEGTLEEVAAFEAHSDYIRQIAVHPTAPYVLSAGDDKVLKLWDWESGWQCARVFEGHSHYVIDVAFDPADSSVFASASLDCTAKVWSLESPTATITLQGHEKGVDCVDFIPGRDGPLLITGSDDKLLKVWDCKARTCVATLEGHAHNLASVRCHPQLPIIMSTSEDGTIRIWNAATFELEKTVDLGLQRVWAVAFLEGSKSAAFGCDEGMVFVDIGEGDAAASSAAADSGKGVSEKLD